MSLDNFAFVLFKPQSAGNIGAAARALKNMGLRDLRIVAPQAPVDFQATTMAVHGRDLLASASIYPDLISALSDRTLTVGTTARGGLYRGDAKSVREICHDLIVSSQCNRIAVVFGPEDSGLSNQEIKLCQTLVTIPTVADYTSLNLAQAVLIVAYELMLSAGAARDLPASMPSAPIPEVEAMLARLAQALVRIGFLPEDNPDHIMFAIRAMLGRARLTSRELDIMNGITRQISWFGGGGWKTLDEKLRTGKKLR